MVFQLKYRPVDKRLLKNMVVDQRHANTLTNCTLKTYGKWIVIYKSWLVSILGMVRFKRIGQDYKVNTARIVILEIDCKESGVNDIFIFYFFSIIWIREAWICAENTKPWGQFVEQYWKKSFLLLNDCLRNRKIVVTSSMFRILFAPLFSLPGH